MEYLLVSRSYNRGSNGCFCYQRSKHLACMQRQNPILKKKKEAPCAWFAWFMWVCHVCCYIVTVDFFPNDDSMQSHGHVLYDKAFNMHVPFTMHAQIVRHCSMHVQIVSPCTVQQVLVLCKCR